jgi:hypothetical protein
MYLFSTHSFNDQKGGTPAVSKVKPGLLTVALEKPTEVIKESAV